MFGFRASFSLQRGPGPVIIFRLPLRLRGKLLEVAFGDKNELAITDFEGL
jgi:hypothetical protein